VIGVSFGVASYLPHCENLVTALPGHAFDEVVAWLEQTTGKPIGQAAASRSSRARLASAPPR
jgi:hypothetical protein